MTPLTFAQKLTYVRQSTRQYREKMAASFHAMLRMGSAHRTPAVIGLCVLAAVNAQKERQ